MSVWLEQQTQGDVLLEDIMWRMSGGQSLHWRDVPELADQIEAAIAEAKTKNDYVLVTVLYQRDQILLVGPSGIVSIYKLLSDWKLKIKE